MEERSLFRLIWAAILAALEFIVTYMVRIPVAVISGAYLNAGDAVIYGGTYLMDGGLYAALAAGIGSALADLLAGAMVYILPTFLIKTLMSFVCGLIYKAKKGTSGFVFGSLVAGLIMVGGYFITETILYGVATAAASVLLNLVQYAFGVVVAVPVYFGIRRLKGTEGLDV